MVPKVKAHHLARRHPDERDTSMSDVFQEIPTDSAVTGS
jgi:hypothetical protein